MPYDEEMLSTVPTVDYEFPNGLGGEYGAERYRIAETLFNPAFYRGAGGGAGGGGGQSMLNVAHACTTSVGQSFTDNAKFDNVLVIEQLNFNPHNDTINHPASCSGCSIKHVIC